MLGLSAVGLWAGFQKRSIKCQLYFWILKATNMGLGLAGRETQSLNLQQLEHTMQLKNFACVYVHLPVCVCVHLRVCVCAQKIKCPDASRCKRISASRHVFCSRTFGMYYKQYLGKGFKLSEFSGRFSVFSLNIYTIGSHL